MGRPRKVKVVEETPAETPVEVKTDESEDDETVIEEIKGRQFCIVCGGSGLARPEFAGSEYCMHCNGAGYEPI